MNGKISVKEDLIFWNQILGDHSRFISNSLAPTEVMAIQEARNFIAIFDGLLLDAKGIQTQTQLDTVLQQTMGAMLQIRAFKVHLLNLHLEKKLLSSLTPTFYNHMLNELEHGYLILTCHYTSRTSIKDPVSLHLLWLLDAVGHAEVLYCTSDPSMADCKMKMKEFKKKFKKFYQSAVEFEGFKRAKLGLYPALQHFDRKTAEEMNIFMCCLDKVKEESLNAEVIGIFVPLVPDHMAREECYYLMRLHIADPSVPEPNCVPWRDRVQS